MWRRGVVCHGTAVVRCWERAARHVAAALQACYVLRVLKLRAAAPGSGYRKMMCISVSLRTHALRAPLRVAPPLSARASGATAALLATVLASSPDTEGDSVMTAAHAGGARVCACVCVRVCGCA